MNQLTYIDPAAQRYSDFGAIATSQGHQPGSGDWWKALRTARDNANETSAKKRDDAAIIKEADNLTGGVFNKLFK